MTDFQSTTKQIEILRLVLEATDNSNIIALIDLHKRLSYGPAVSKQAILCSIRILEEHGLVQRVYGAKHSPVHTRGQRQYIRPTMKTYQLLRRETMEI